MNEEYAVEKTPLPEQIKTSNNQTLEGVFRANPEYVNREYTLPAEVNQTPIFLADGIAGTPLEEVIRSNLRTIVPSAMAAQLPQESQNALTVMASPYECGRVLELDDKVEIYGVPHVITFKGVGATTFARKTGGENPWMMAGHRHFTSHDAEMLRSVPFWKHYGILDEKEALTELEGARRIEGVEVDTEKILAIFKLESIPEGGVQKPISHYKNEGRVPGDFDPVIMVRAVKSNLRLLDMVMLDELQKEGSIPAFVEHVTAEYGRYEKIENPTFQDYFFWLVKKMIGQELPLILQGYKMSSGRWQDLGRNVSTMGEELDTQDMIERERTTRTESYYLEDVENNFANIERVLRQFAERAVNYGSVEIDEEVFATIVVSEARKVLSSANMEERHKKFQGRGGDSYDEFKALIEKSLFKMYTNFEIYFGKKSSKLYQKKAEELIGI